MKVRVPRAILTSRNTYSTASYYMIELRRTDRRQSETGISRDFSVIHSKQKRCSQLFLGPARFVNVSSRLHISSRYSYSFPAR